MRVEVDLEILAEFLSKAFGNRTEIAVHDLENPDSSLCILKNGHVTGRSVGMGLTELAMNMIDKKDGEQQSPYKINYNGRTSDGRNLRSSTIMLCDKNQEPKYLLCLNHDDAHVHQLIDHLQQITKIEDDQSDEHFDIPMDKIGKKIISDVMAQNYTPVDKLSAQEKENLVAKMYDAGAFEIKGSVEIAADMLNVSESTLYRYLKRV